MVYSTWDLRLDVGETEILRVKMFTVLLWREIHYYTMYMVSG